MIAGSSFRSCATAGGHCKMLRPIHAIVSLLCIRCLTVAHIADKWRLPPPAAKAEVIAQWQAKDKSLHAFLAESIPEALAHTGAVSFDQHLMGVQSVLRNWGADEDVATAGLFHSIYGTEGFQGFKLPFAKRIDVNKLVGGKSERLVWIFCIVDRLSVDELVEKHLLAANKQLPGPYQCLARFELGRFPIEFKDENEWLDFVELTLADWLEQVEGAAEKQNPLYGWDVGEAWSYRRVAYHKMADLLVATRGERLLRAKQMVEEVYGAEPEKTRELHQRITPPMNDAAREARAAWASRFVIFDKEANDSSGSCIL